MKGEGEEGIAEEGEWVGHFQEGKPFVVWEKEESEEVAVLIPPHSHLEPRRDWQQ